MTSGLNRLLHFKWIASMAICLGVYLLLFVALFSEFEKKSLTLKTSHTLSSWNEEVHRAILNGDYFTVDRVFAGLSNSKIDHFRILIDGSDAYIYPDMVMSQASCSTSAQFPFSSSGLSLGSVKVCFDQTSIFKSALSSPLLWLSVFFLALIFVVFNWINIRAYGARAAQSIKLLSNLEANSSHGEKINQFFTDLSASTDPLMKKIGLLLKKNISLETKAVKYEAQKSIVAQVDHDIASPLSALAIVSDRRNDSVTGEQMQLLRSATERIQRILSDLKTKNNLETTESVAPLLVEPVALQVIEEKKLNYKNSNVVLSLINLCKGKDLVRTPKEVLERSLSNLIDNAIHACLDGDGRVLVKIEKENGFVSISVIDNGIGIQERKLDLITQKGFTFGKEKGSGLGLHYVSSKASELNGSLAISSKEGTGTTVNLSYPHAYGDGITNQQIVLIDDDPLIHRVWEMRARESGVTAHLFKTVPEFVKKSENIDKSAEIYLDANLSDQSSEKKNTQILKSKGFLNIIRYSGEAVNPVSNRSLYTRNSSKDCPF